MNKRLSETGGAYTPSLKTDMSNWGVEYVSVSVGEMGNVGVLGRHYLSSHMHVRVCGCVCVVVVEVWVTQWER